LPPRFKDWASRLAGIKAGEDANQIENSLYDALWAALGGEARQPLGLVVVGGLLFSQLVILYLTPVFYTYMAAIQERLRGRKGTLKEEPLHGLVAGD
jgi:hypothetical protein